MRRSLCWPDSPGARAGYTLTLFRRSSRDNGQTAPGGDDPARQVFRPMAGMAAARLLTTRTRRVQLIDVDALSRMPWDGFARAPRT